MSEKIPVAKTKSIRECGYDEIWLQDQINEAPIILGLGELEVVRREKKQPIGGKIDFLLQNPEDDSMYEVEVMLGSTDESHIIRTIEYWDNEKRRWPLRQHYAVLVAETITRRFFNVISLLSLNIPLIAIQVNMLEVNDQNILHFTKVLDIDEEPEIDSGEIYDENYWKNKSPWTIENAKALKDIVDKIYSNTSLRYVKNYVSITVDNNLLFWFHKRSGNKSMLNFRVDSEYVEEFKTLLDEKNWTYIFRNDIIRLTIDKEKMMANKDFIHQLVEKLKLSSG